MTALIPLKQLSPFPVKLLSFVSPCGSKVAPEICRLDQSHIVFGPVFCGMLVSRRSGVDSRTFGNSPPAIAAVNAATQTKSRACSCSEALL